MNDSNEEVDIVRKFTNSTGNSFVIKVPYDIPYLYLYESSSGGESCVARLDDLETIVGRLKLSREQAISLIIPLIESRITRTSKQLVKEVLLLVLKKVREEA